MKSHAKAVSAGSTSSRGSRLGSICRGAFATRGASSDADGTGAPSLGRAPFFAALAIAALSLLVLAGSASAAPLREIKSTFGSADFGGPGSGDPQALTVDQSNGDIYAFGANFPGQVFRYDSTGAPKNFSATGDNSLGNFLSDSTQGASQVAVDNSGGANNGDIYVTALNNSTFIWQITIFDNDGNKIGALDGSTTPNAGFNQTCGVAVDQSNGNLYVGDWGGNVWRYTPSGGTLTDADYSGGIATGNNPCSVAADSGKVYAAASYGAAGPAKRYAASDFTLGSPPSVAGTQIDANATALATDPSTGDLYVDEGDQIQVYDSTGSPQYTFGSSADFGTDSAGVAVKGAGGKAYVADRTAGEIDVYGLVARSHATSFGSADFGGPGSGDPQALTVDQSNGDIYAFGANFPGQVFRYDSTGAPKNFSATGDNSLGNFLSDSTQGASQVAVDNSGGANNGDIYVTALNNSTFIWQITIFDNDGNKIGALDGSTTPNAGFNQTCGVAVDQSNGNLYVGDWGGNVWRYTPSGGTLTDADYSGGIATGNNPCSVAADSGKVYAAASYGAAGPAKRYAASDFTLGSPPSVAGTQIDANATALATDPSTGDLYVDEGDQIQVYDSTGSPQYTFGSSADFGTDSAGVAVKGAGGKAYVADRTAGEIDVYGLVARSHATSFGSADFGGPGSGDPQALTVDQSNGDIYAFGANFPGQVFRYDSTGAPKNFSATGDNSLGNFLSDSTQGASQVAVDNSGGANDGDIYVTALNNSTFIWQITIFDNDGNKIGALDGSTTPNAGFNQTCGVAVDQSNGNLYVGDWGGNVWRYTPSGGTLTDADYSGGIATGNNPCSVAADSGKVYAAASYGAAGPAKRYAASDFTLGSPPSVAGTQIDANATALATDPSTGDLYVDEGDQIQVYDSTGSPQYTFGSSADFGTDSAGVAVKGAGGKAYVADRTAGEIDVYGPFSLSSPPAVTTQAASGIGLETATLHATVNPRGALVTDCHFDYVDDFTYQADLDNNGGDPAHGFDHASTAPCDPTPGSGGGSVPVSADLTGLSTGTIYHVRAVATNGGGTTSADPITFDTTPIAVTDPATNLHHTDAVLNGHIVPNGDTITACSFDWGTSVSYGHSVDCSEGGSFTDAANVSAAINDLTPGQTVHYRLHLTTTAHGDATGHDLTLKPRPFPVIHKLTDTIGTPGGGGGAGQFSGNTGVAVDQSTGDVYVADRLNHRVVKLDSNGNFVWAAGRDVVASGPDNLSGSDTHQQVTVGGATGGSFRLLLQTAEGTGAVHQGSTTVDNLVTAGGFNVGDQITGSDIAAGTTVAAVGSGQLTLSAPPSSPGSGCPGCSDTTTLTAAAATAPISFDASAAAVQSALEGLPNLDPGDVQVTGPGGGPWDVAFVGSRAGTDVPQLGGDGANLIPSAGSYVIAPITQQGGASEVCRPSSGDTCRAGAAGDALGQFKSPHYLAVDNSGGPSEGDLYVVDDGQGTVQKFDPTGNLVTSWASGGRLPNPYIPDTALRGGIAVDATGALVERIVYAISGLGRKPRLWTYDGSSGAQSGELIDPTGYGGGFSTVGPLAIDAGGSFLLLQGSGQVERFDPADPGTLSGPLLTRRDGRTSTVVTDMARDPATGDVYLAARPAVFAGQPAQIRRYSFTPDGGVLQADTSTCQPREIDLGANTPDEGCDPLETFGVGDLIAPTGIGVNGDTDTSYVSDSGQIKIFHGHTVTSPTVTSGLLTDLTATSATFHAKVDPEGFGVTDCHFAYTDDADFQANGYANASEVPCDPDPGSGSGDVDVSAAVTGLSEGVGYHFRIEAENATPDSLVHGFDQTFTSKGPRISHAFANPVNTTDATLRATLNPAGAPTAYHFEYGPTGAYGSSTPAVSVGGNSDHEVQAVLTGLGPATTYHFRLVASNADAGASSPDASFTTKATADDCPNAALRSGFGHALPDCRAYEQATPVDKQSSNAEHEIGLTQAADSGDAISFADPGGLPSPGGTSFLPVYIASRDASGWTSANTLPATDPGFGAALMGWSDDLTASLAIGNSASASGVYRWHSSDLSQQLVASAPRSSDQDYLAGFSSDSSRALFESVRPYAAGATPGVTNLYELQDDTVTLAERIPSGSDASCDDVNGPSCVNAPGAFAGPYDWVQGNQNQGGASSKYYTQHTISADGSRIVFTARGTGRIYLREGARTTEISASQASVTDSNGHKPAAWVGATPDDSEVFFLSCEKLTDDSTAVSDPGNPGRCDQPSEGSDLYSYDVGSGELTDLTVDANGGDAHGAQVIGFLGASDDGGTLYFAANGVLASGASPGNNIYALHNGATTLVTRSGVSYAPQFFTPSAGQKTSRVSAAGVLVFESGGQPTGYDNTEADARDCANPTQSGEPCTEIFRFAPADGLSCVSCRPGGDRPHGFASLEQKGLAFGASPKATFLPRNVSADGNRVFFDTNDSLVPGDVNGDGACPSEVQSNGTLSHQGCFDTYEWEADGTGSCHSSAENGGCLFLLSTGTSTTDSYFGDASASGDDAFIFTDDQLVPRDGDQLVDAYDVRVDGGLASQQVTPPPPCDASAGACEGPGSTAPPTTGAGSAAINGPEDPAVVRRKHCARGKVRRHGRCVSRHPHKKKHHKRKVHHKRTGSERGGQK